MEKKCSSCKKGLSSTQIGLFTLSAYILLASIIGTFEIGKFIISLFY